MTTSEKLLELGYKPYLKKEATWLKPWEGEALANNVFISKLDKLHGSPKKGDMIGIIPESFSETNPENQQMYLITQEAFKQNFADTQNPTESGTFGVSYISGKDLKNEMNIGAYCTHSEVSREITKAYSASSYGILDHEVKTESTKIIEYEDPFHPDGVREVEVPIKLQNPEVYCRISIPMSTKKGVIVQNAIYVCEKTEDQFLCRGEYLESIERILIDRIPEYSDPQSFILLSRMFPEGSSKPDF